MAYKKPLQFSSPCRTEVAAVLYFLRNGVKLHFYSLGTMINNILMEVLSSIAEQERVRTLERQAQGIGAAKRKGKHLGRPQIAVPDN